MGSQTYGVIEDNNTKGRNRARVFTIALGLGGAKKQL